VVLVATLLGGTAVWAQGAPATPNRPATPTAASTTPQQLLTEYFLEVSPIVQGLTLDRWEGEVRDPNGVAPPRVVRRGDNTGVVPMFGVYLRGAAHLRRWLYVAVHLQWSAGVNQQAPARLGALPARTALQYGTGVAVGLHWRMFEPVAFRVELGATLLAVCVCFIDCPARDARGELFEPRVRLEPRAFLDVRVSPTISLGILGGTDVLLPEEWTAGLSLRWTRSPHSNRHLFGPLTALDRWPTQSNARTEQRTTFGAPVIRRWRAPVRSAHPPPAPRAARAATAPRRPPPAGASPPA